MYFFFFRHVGESTVATCTLVATFLYAGCIYTHIHDHMSIYICIYIRTHAHARTHIGGGVQSLHAGCTYIHAYTIA